MNIAKLTVMALAASTVSGCWLGITTKKGTPPPVAAATTQPVTTVPAPSYTGQALLIFDAINSYRTKMDFDGGPGVGKVAQDTHLDTAAENHEVYLTSQPGGDIETHYENVSGMVTPHDRAVNAGFLPDTAWIGEVIGTGQATTDPNSGLPACVSQLLDSVYHLEALTSNVEKIGIYNDPNWACVLEGATVTGTDSMILPSSGNDEPVGGGQQMSDTSVAVAPYKGETGVLTAMSTGENPIPALPSNDSGHPVMLRMRADFDTDVLRVDSFTLSTAATGPVAGTILLAANAAATSTSSAQTDGLVQPGVAFFVPMSPLNATSTYTAHFVGARNGVSVDKTWSFTTQ